MYNIGRVVYYICFWNTCITVRLMYLNSVQVLTSISQPQNVYCCWGRTVTNPGGSLSWVLTPLTGNKEKKYGYV